MTRSDGDRPTDDVLWTDDTDVDDVDDDDAVDEFDDDDDEDDGWCDVDVGDGTTVRLPDPEQYGFRDHVEVIASASACWSPYGPMSREMREHICCVGDVYLLHSGGDSGSDIEIVGRFASSAEGIDACVEASTAFVPSRDGEPVSAWSDEDEDGDIDDEELWSADDDDDEDDDDSYAPAATRGHGPPRRGCLVRPSSHGAHRRIVRRPSRVFSQAERLQHLEELWATTIVHRDVVIAGDGASDALPAAGPWLVVPCDDDEFAHLDRVIGGLERAEVTIGTEVTCAALTDRMPPTTAARVGAAFSVSTIWQLDYDSAQSIWTDPAIVIARALRVR